MAVLCRDCWRGKLGMDHTPPSVRTSRDSCEFCGAAGPNYTYPTELIPGQPGDVDMAADKEERM
jgi:hypothetical protein